MLKDKFNNLAICEHTNMTYDRSDVKSCLLKMCSYLLRIYKRFFYLVVFVPKRIYKKIRTNIRVVLFEIPFDLDSCLFGDFEYI